MSESAASGEDKDKQMEIWEKIAKRLSEMNP